MVNALSHTGDELIVLHFKFRIHRFQAFIPRCTVRHLKLIEVVRLFIAQTRRLRHAARSSDCSRLDITIDGRNEEEPVSISVLTSCEPALSRLLTRGHLKIHLTSCPRFKHGLILTNKVFLSQITNRKNSISKQDVFRWWITDQSS